MKKLKNSVCAAILLTAIGQFGWEATSEALVQAEPHWASREVGKTAVQPVAESLWIVTDEDTPVAIQLAGSDPTGLPITYAVVRSPREGALSGTAPGLVYTPGPEFNGMDCFTYRVNNGLADSRTATVTIVVNPVNDPPTAAASASVASGNAPLAVEFTGVGTDAESDPLVFSWSFGDGGIGGGESISHTFVNPGTYMVALTVTDPFETSATANVRVVVIGAPTAAASASVTSGTAPLAVEFTGAGSDPQGAPLTYSWDFGDGATGSGERVSHAFANPGRYTVVLTVANPLGATGTAGVAIEVAAPAPPPSPSDDETETGTDADVGGPGQVLPGEDVRLTVNFAKPSGSSLTCRVLRMPAGAAMRAKRLETSDGSLVVGEGEHALRFSFQMNAKGMGRADGLRLKHDARRGALEFKITKSPALALLAGTSGVVDGQGLELPVEFQGAGAAFSVRVHMIWNTGNGKAQARLAR